MLLIDFGEEERDYPSLVLKDLTGARKESIRLKGDETVGDIRKKARKLFPVWNHKGQEEMDIEIKLWFYALLLDDDKQQLSDHHVQSGDTINVSILAFFECGICLERSNQRGECRMNCCKQYAHFCCIQALAYSKPFACPYCREPGDSAFLEKVLLCP